MRIARAGYLVEIIILFVEVKIQELKWRQRTDSTVETPAVVEGFEIVEDLCASFGDEN